MNEEKQLIFLVECSHCGKQFKAFERHLYWICPKCKNRYNNPVTKEEVQRFKETETEQ